MIDAEKLKELRKAKRMSQQLVADLAGISQTQISRIEQGQGDTTTEILVRLAEAVGVKPAALLAENPQRPRAVATARRRIVPASRELGTAGA